MRIPITMCHGVNPNRQPPLDAEHLEGYFRIASDLGFTSISYDDLVSWRNGEETLPDRPIMFDFDHPSKSIRHVIQPLMGRYGYKGNLFVNTGWMEELYSAAIPNFESRKCMIWEELQELMAAGWHIGAHTHTHPNLSDLGSQDPSGALIREELEKNDKILEEHLGIIPTDFAFTGTTWSRVAENEVKKRYRFGRLWIIGTHYEADGGQVRYAEIVGVPGPDEDDGGPPFAARYITEETHDYRLPSMEFEHLTFEHDAFERYPKGALGEHS